MTKATCIASRRDYRVPGKVTLTLTGKVRGSVETLWSKTAPRAADGGPSEADLAEMRAAAVSFGANPRTVVLL